MEGGRDWGTLTHHPVKHGLEGYRLLSEDGHDREARVCVSHLLHAIDPETACEYGVLGETILMPPHSQDLVMT